MDLFDIQGGTQPPKNVFRDEPQSGYIQLLQIRDFGERPVPTYIPDIDTLKKCTEQDILIARYGASLGRILTGFSGAYNVAMAKVDIPEGMCRQFTYHLLRSEIFQAPLRLVSRSAQSGFNKQDLAEIELPVAPFNEQSRIADKLDSLLARVDDCRDRLDRVPPILKCFRQSVLIAAISGELTEDWRADINRSLDSWQTKYGEDVFSLVTSGSRGWAVYYSDEGAKFLRVGNLNHDTIELDFKNLQHVNPPLNAEGKRTRIEVGDILISITADIGMVAFVREDIGEAYINQHLCLARQTGEYLGAYLAYYLASPLGGIGQLTQIQRGATKAGLTLGDIRSVTFLIPELDEQDEIVRRVESLFAYADRLEARYKNALRQVERLTPTLLSTAFRGELVSQDPNDEPASVLLERIRSERAAQPIKPKRALIDRKPTMKKMSRESVKEVIHQLPNDIFSFDELREQLPEDYDSLKEILFTLLDEAEPSIIQVFDQEVKAIRFIRGQQ